MALARETRVIKLAGSPTDLQQQDALEVEEIIDDADQRVYDYTRTKASDWVEGVTSGYDWARNASEYLAAARLCEEFHDINNKAEVYRKAAMEDLKVLRQIGYGTKDGDNPSFYSTTSKVATAELRASQGRYRSKNFFGGEYDY